MRGVGGVGDVDGVERAGDMREEPATETPRDVLSAAGHGALIAVH